MITFEKPVKLAPNITIGEDKLVLIAGPCVVENYDLCAHVAETVKDICSGLGVQYIFKASFDKANRTSSSSFRSLGFDESLKILEKVKEQFAVPILTDVHETIHVDAVAQVVDVLQIPAFLCRQTDLLHKCGETGKGVNIKKGQFMAPHDMKYAVDKVQETGNANVALTERGTTFGYNNLVVDIRSLPIMRQYAPVIFDVTHSIQMPGGAGGKSGGQREFAPYLAKAAAAAGIDGFFIETHPEPEKALSDGPNMIPLNQLKDLINSLNTIFRNRTLSEE